jgi:seryl-tRNA synthetase
MAQDKKIMDLFNIVEALKNIVKDQDNRLKEQDARMNKIASLIDKIGKGERFPVDEPIRENAEYIICERHRLFGYVAGCGFCF